MSAERVQTKSTTKNDSVEESNVNSGQCDMGKYMIRNFIYAPTATKAGMKTDDNGKCRPVLSFKPAVATKTNLVKPTSNVSNAQKVKK